MQKIKEKLNKFRKSWRVPSNSKKGVFYRVDIMNNGSMACTCDAGSHHRPCRHKRRILNKLKGITYGGENYQPVVHQS